MAAIEVQDIHIGWKVYMGSEEVGTVAEVGDDELAVERGGLIKRVVRIPKDEVAEAGEGIVDLRPDRDMMDRLKGGD